MVDDFTAWLVEFDDEIVSFIKTLKEIDFYFLSLSELRNTLVAVTTEHFGKLQHEKNIS